MYRFKYAAISDVGRSRELNEDNYLVRDNLFAVADGMGGHLAGEIASNIALKSVARALKRGDSPRRRIAAALKAANTQIVKQAGRVESQRGMGTTLTLAMIIGKNLWIGHVGDSRAYLYRRGELRRLTQDHTLVARLVAEGKLSAAEAVGHPQQHVITKAVGGHSDIEADVMNYKIQRGDRLLLCTDGLTNMLSDAEIAAAVSTLDPQQAAQLLVDGANAKGGLDNITVVIVDILGRESDKADRRPLWRRLLPVVVALVVVLLVAIAAYSGWRRVYYIAPYRGRVAVYQGLPLKIGGRALFKLTKTTSLSLNKLPDYYQRRVKQGIIIGSRDQAMSTLRDIESLGRGD